MLALWLTSGQRPPGWDPAYLQHLTEAQWNGATFLERFIAAQHSVLTTTDSDLGTWPEALGTPPWGAAALATLGSPTAYELSLKHIFSAQRRAAAERFAAAVGDELAHLAMGSARIQVAVTPRPLGPHGADDVEIQLAANSGAPARSVGRAASGGELSRLCLLYTSRCV